MPLPVPLCLSDVRLDVPRRRLGVHRDAQGSRRDARPHRLALRARLRHPVPLPLGLQRDLCRPDVLEQRLRVGPPALFVTSASSPNPLFCSLFVSHTRARALSV